MARFEVGLGQGWTRGLKVVFEDAATTAALDLTRFTSLKQVHGKDIVTVEPAHARAVEVVGTGDGLYLPNGLVLEYPKPIAVKTADCVPLVYVERENQSVAIVHAGWRGLAQGIHRVPFERRWFNPATTWIWVGPSLNGGNFEVGPDVWNQFPREANNAAIFKPVAGGAPDRRHFFVWDYLRAEFARQGVELVYLTEIDTFADVSFASYRRHKRDTGSTNYGVGNLSWVGFSAPTTRDAS